MPFTPQEIEKRANELIDAGVGKEDVLAFIQKAQSEVAPAPAPAAPVRQPEPQAAPTAPIDPAMLMAAARAGGGGMVGGYPISAEQAQNVAGYGIEAALPAVGQAVGTAFGPPGTAAGGFVGGAAGKLLGGAIRGETPSMGQIASSGIGSMLPGKPLRDIGKMGLAMEAGKQAGMQLAAGATEAAIEGKDFTPAEAAARGAGAILGTVAGKTFDMGAIADAETAKKLNKAVQDEVYKKALATGAKILPSDVNTSKINRLMEALGGKSQLVAELKDMNEEWATAMAAKSVGLPARPAVLTQAALEDAREKAGQIYGTIDGLKSIAERNLETIKKPLLRIADKHEMEVAMADKDTVEKMSKLAIQAAADVNAFKREQFNSRAYYKMFNRDGNPEILDKAKAAEEAAMVLNNKIKKGLESIDRKDLWEQFEASRKKIAMIHQIEDALNLEGSTVSGKALSQALGRGAPLTDQLETIAKFAGQRKSGKYFASGEAGNVESKGTVSELVDAFLRKPARDVVLSPTYQQFMARPSYQAMPDFLARAARSGTQSTVPGTILQFYAELYPRKPEQVQQPAQVPFR